MKCDYPPCDQPATTEFDTDPAFSGKTTGHLCDEHAAQARALRKKWITMTDEEYRAHIEDLVDHAPGLDDEQRARIGRILREKRKPS